MGGEQLRALGALTFNWTRAQEDVWSQSPYHVEGLHSEGAELIRRGIDEARASARTSPLGVALQGERGVGKTHLLGWTRQEVQRSGGYFFLVGISSGKTFWEEVLGAILERLQPYPGSDRSQLEMLLDDLADKVGLTGTVRDAVTGRTPPSRDDVDAFANGLWRLDRSGSPLFQSAARALVLLASPKQEHHTVGSCFLSGLELEPEERQEWGIRSYPKVLQPLVAELSKLLALSGPTVVAVDQIDALIDDIGKAEAAATPDATRLVTQVAGGLMELRDLTRRTLTIVACLPESWDFIKNHAVDTVTDRFRPALQLRNIPSANVGRSMIEKRFAVDFATVGFAPPYPSWPILPGAFEDANRFTARQLLKRIEAHVNSCLRDGAVRELERLDDEGMGQPTGVPPADKKALAGLDARFAELYAAADVALAFDPKTEDAMVPGLLTAGLDAWIREHGRGDEFVQDSLPPGRNPTLHACLLQTIDDHTERQRHWGFRAIATDNATALLSRLRPAITKVALDSDNPDRRLFILRNTSWPTGPTTKRVTDAFAVAGGVALAVNAGDLKTFAALRTMLDERDPNLDAWLAERRPAGNTELLSRALADVTPVRRMPQPQKPEPPRIEPVAEHAIRIGTTTLGDAPASLVLESLRKHTVIFAGSGSGKTVLLRRIVEECALHGVSAIVLDPNNDLARLGDAWPEPPDSWRAGDAERASEYLANTDVVVWTPRRQSGRPLTFQPLPVFTDIIDSDDEFQAAVDAAVEALVPRVNANKGTDKAMRERAVLKGALQRFARAGGNDLGDFISFLAALPEGASAISKAAGTAADLADKLEAARVNDPLFGGSGQAADPGMLLTPPSGKRARVSVISLIGLPSEEQRQSFVNQLQMALFSWVKKHPASSDRPLGGLFVMDEAQTLASSMKSTASTESTIRLASQARKYGLGLVFATQAPRGLHNQIPGNATTQFYGLLNSPTQIDAARDLARAKGSDLPDIGRLTTGQFYLATEGRGFHKIRTPMCLSHHPSSPLTEEEVISRARRDS